MYNKQVLRPTPRVLVQANKLKKESSNKFINKTYYEYYQPDVALSTDCGPVSILNSPVNNLIDICLNQFIGSFFSVLLFYCIIVLGKLHHKKKRKSSDNVTRGGPPPRVS